MVRLDEEFGQALSACTDAEIHMEKFAAKVVAMPAKDINDLALKADVVAYLFDELHEDDLDPRFEALDNLLDSILELRPRN